MKKFLIILHSLVLCTGVVLILDLPVLKEIIEIPIYFFIFYTIFAFTINLIKSFGILTFPRQLGTFSVFIFISIQFILKRHTIIDQSFAGNFIVYATSIVALSMLIITIKKSSFNFRYGKTDINGFSQLFKTNFWLYLILFPTFISLVFLIGKHEKSNLILRILALVLSFVPLLNKEFVCRLSNLLGENRDFAEIGYTLSQFGKLGEIRNFVFFKDKILSTSMYQIAESDFRSSVRVTTVVQIARILADDWNARYAKLFVIDEYEKVDLSYRLVHKSENGITVIDDDACMYHLGNSTYVKDKIKWDDRANLFLLKNDIPIAKFKVNEKILPEKIELLNQLDYYGNTLLIHNGHIQDLGYDYTILFDKIYEEIIENKQLELLKELEKKAPTAIFVSQSPKEVVNSICFHVSTDNLPSDNHSNIPLNAEKLLEVPKLFGIAKKVKQLFKNLQLISIIFQVLFCALSLVLYKNLIILFALNFGIIVLADFFEVFLSKRISNFRLEETVHDKNID